VLNIQKKDSKQSQLAVNVLGTLQTEGTLPSSNVDLGKVSKGKATPAADVLVFPDLWQVVIEYLEEKDRERLKKCQIDQVDIIGSNSSPILVNSILEKAKLIQKEDKEKKWKPVS
jgi:hypothetical protein